MADLIRKQGKSPEEEKQKRKRKLKTRVGSVLRLWLHSEHFWVSITGKKIKNLGLA